MSKLVLNASQQCDLLDVIEEHVNRINYPGHLTFYKDESDNLVIEILEKTNE